MYTPNEFFSTLDFAVSSQTVFSQTLRRCNGACTLAGVFNLCCPIITKEVVSMIF